MQIYKTKTFVNIEKINMEDEDAFHMWDVPYMVEREETESEIVWFGYNYNWKYIKSIKQWYILEGSEFVVTTKPEYEYRYEQTIFNNNIISKV